jgi:hypothetical protein
MKIRNGFVSNSSSSSFVICKQNLSKKQIEGIQDFLFKQEISSEDTCVTETSKHFFGTISQHVDPSMEIILNSLGIPKEIFEKE